ncbi:hypothetical protein [Pseudonocardia sp. NPDC049635]|uniref:hypothetical protein n=1 Tax=Pseudonocardia sp. NPDC049635 TaxID=3155506 RepID=UPI0033DF3925
MTTNTAPAAIDAAAAEIARRCGGDHTLGCAWHAASAVAENAAETRAAATVDEMVENGLALIDDACTGC